MAERRTVNAVVVGSNPARGASFLFSIIFLVLMPNGRGNTGELASSDEREIHKLEKRVNKLENTVERLFQIMDAQVYGDEKPPEDL